MWSHPYKSNHKKIPCNLGTELISDIQRVSCSEIFYIYVLISKNKMSDWFLCDTIRRHFHLKEMNYITLTSYSNMHIQNYVFSTMCNYIICKLWSISCNSHKYYFYFFCRLNKCEYNTVLKIFFLIKEILSSSCFKMQ